MEVPFAPVDQLHKRLGLSDPIDYPSTSLAKPLTQWRMEDDDSPILRYLYRNFRPRRHLEFGTWQGTGAVYVLEECEATVWTINLPEGELTAEGGWAYSSNFRADDVPWRSKASAWVRRKVVGISGSQGSQRLYGYQTDSLGFIGRYYLEKGLGHRVCQIYCDTRKWDITNYPVGFFDSCLIDGGHQYETVASDTMNALHLVRPGGIILWHDFCPVPEVLAQCTAPREVVGFVRDRWDLLRTKTSDLFWIRPSHILLGVRA
jgi:predicted O-methyltransferase YrrM